jgi:predicted nucleic acid-binding protein
LVFFLFSNVLPGEIFDTLLKFFCFGGIILLSQFRDYKIEGSVFMFEGVKIRRVYVDTSVVGGLFDKEFRELTKPFWDAVQNGQITIIFSSIIEGELLRSPEHVRAFFLNLPSSQKERVVVTEEVETLAEAYISAKVVGRSSLDDCKHIAMATLSNSDVIVSWNFKHIVNIDRIRGYNGINQLLGYPQLEIRTPSEVIYER